MQGVSIFRRTPRPRPSRRPSRSTPPRSAVPCAGGILPEAAAAILFLALGFHFLALRIRAGGLPGGDEGSWIAVASELAQGRGFTTRWLEAHFLLPYALPRPDDFRYPALTSLLALAFRLFGDSVETARWTVGAVFLAFAAAVWGVSRAAFGRWAALATLLATVTSLLQLEWNATVYTEGLFGLAAAGLAAWCLRGERTRGSEAPFGFRSHAFWAVLGAAMGLLYLVRVNGILFVPGIAWLWLRRRSEPLRWTHAALALAAFAATAAPWLLRTALDFGNPFHFAGSGGLLRDPGAAATQSHTLSAAEYFGRHDPLFLPRRLAAGAGALLRDLHRFEHGLELAPLLLAVVASARRRSFFGPAFAAGFALSALACAYAAYNSWAGVRYFSGLVPFLYAYGFSQAPDLVRGLVRSLAGLPFPWRSRRRAGARMSGMDTLPGRRSGGGRTPSSRTGNSEGTAEALPQDPDRGLLPVDLGVSPMIGLAPGPEPRSPEIGRRAARAAAGVLGLLLAAAPVVQPHRFYERSLSARIAASGPYAYRPTVADHLDRLLSRVPPGGSYYAASLCNLNFLAPGRLCVGLQELYNPSWLPRSLAAFAPGLVALTRAERADSTLRAALERMREAGHTPVTVDSGSLGVYFALERESAAGEAEAESARGHRGGR